MRALAVLVALKVLKPTKSRIGHAKRGRKRIRAKYAARAGSGEQRWIEEAQGPRLQDAGIQEYMGTYAPGWPWDR